MGEISAQTVGITSAYALRAQSRHLRALSTAQRAFSPAGNRAFSAWVCFRSRWQLYLGSGIGPKGEGDNTIVAFAPNNNMQPSRLVSDPELSPLDLAIAPNGNIVVSSEHPFGASDAVTTVREYDAADGHLVRIFRPKGSAEFRRPRGLRFGPDGNLYCVAQDGVIAFDFGTANVLGSWCNFAGCMARLWRFSRSNASLFIAAECFPRLATLPDLGSRQRDACPQALHGCHQRPGLLL